LPVSLSNPSPKSEPSFHYKAPRKMRQRGSGTIMTVNLTPAIDITFNLLIFFIVATTFKAAEGVLPSKAPVEQGILEATPLPVSPVKVRLRQTGEGWDNYKLKIDNWRIAPESFTDLTRILEAIQQKPGFDQDTPIIIFAENEAQWDLVVRCFNAIRRANIYPDQYDPNRKPFKNISFAAGPR